MSDKSASARTAPSMTLARGRIAKPEGDLVPNRPTPEGRRLGEHLARMADAAEARALERFPNARTRCKSCAFRGGTIPNGCPDTLMDALKCVLEFREFMCHEKPANEEPTQICAGWFEAIASLGPDAKPTDAPWDFSFLNDDDVA